MYKYTRGTYRRNFRNLDCHWDCSLLITPKLHLKCWVTDFRYIKLWFLIIDPGKMFIDQGKPKEISCQKKSFIWRESRYISEVFNMYTICKNFPGTNDLQIISIFFSSFCLTDIVNVADLSCLLPCKLQISTRYISL